MECAANQKRSPVMPVVLGLLALVCFIVVFLVGRPGPAGTIVGKWQEVQGTETLEFFKDGTVTAVDMGVPLSGKYKMADRNRITIELGGLGALAGPQVYQVQVSDNELVLTDAQGVTTKYRRLR